VLVIRQATLFKKQYKNKPQQGNSQIAKLTIRPRMKLHVLTPIISLLLGLSVAQAQQKTVTIATVNNPEMIKLKKLSAKFEQANPETKLSWVVLSENNLRERVTTDVSQGSGQFDLVFLGLYEAPIFAKRGWLRPIENIPDSYDVDDVYKSLRDALSYDGKLYALPYYAESSMTVYRKDLFDAKGLKMPEQPTYDDIVKFADQLTDKSKGVYGIVLRGKAGWGENMAYVTTLVNTFGGRWFDESWHPTIDSPEWQNAIKFYVDLLRKDGPPGASSNTVQDCLTLFARGNAAIWIDATSVATALCDKSQSNVADKIAFAQAPIAVTPKGSHWLWCWAFAIPKSSKNPDGAQKFAEWASSKDLIKLVAQDTGWATVPPATRKSTSESPEYVAAAPFAKITLQAMSSADPTDPCAKKVPYTGVQFVGIPEFQAIGTTVGQNIAGALAGTMSIDQALKNSQNSTQRAMIQAGYIK
jgi:sorbitol/mannitol transport system substrate-binding protein